MTDAPDDLELIPRSVRDKLDRVGIKLHLRDWQKLSLEERGDLVRQPCTSSDEIDHYRKNLEGLIRRRTGSAPEYLAGRR
jgi:hypothetical protein